MSLRGAAGRGHPRMASSSEEASPQAELLLVRRYRQERSLSAGAAAGAAGREDLYQARYAAHARCKSEQSAAPPGDAASKETMDEGEGPARGFERVDSRASNESDSEADSEYGHAQVRFRPLATRPENKYSMSRSARRMLEQDLDTKPACFDGPGSTNLETSLLFEKVAEKLSDQLQLTINHGRGVETQSSLPSAVQSIQGLAEQDELRNKISNIDGKIERLQARKLKYIGRLEKLQGKLERVAGPIQWSEWQQRGRMQVAEPTNAQ